MENNTSIIRWYKGMINCDGDIQMTIFTGKQ